MKRRKKKNSTFHLIIFFFGGMFILSLFFFRNKDTEEIDNIAGSADSEEEVIENKTEEISDGEASENIDGELSEEEGSNFLLNLNIEEGDIFTDKSEVKGKARKDWYFEGSFPVLIMSERGKSIGGGYALIDADELDNKDTFDEDFSGYEDSYMIPFKVIITQYSLDNDIDGEIIFKKDNPSDEETVEDQEYRLKVKIRQEGVM